MIHGEQLELLGDRRDHQRKVWTRDRSGAANAPEGRTRRTRKTFCRIPEVLDNVAALTWTWVKIAAASESRHDRAGADRYPALYTES